MSQEAAKLTFWGVRGSTPTVDRSTWRYGGNTACVELETPEGGRFILDCGTGLRMLGNSWQESQPNEAQEASIFLTHYHWDHIQGIPFFAPLYAQQNRFHFYSFRSKYLGRHSLEQVLEAQMARPYFPVDLSVMTAKREFTEISGGDKLELKGACVTAAWLNHPQGCLGFRIETSGGTVVYATDNEPGVLELDENLRRLAKGADIFINDAQYSPEVLAGSRKGWGHSSWQEGVKIAKEAGARNLVLFHHDPDSSDTEVDALLHQARQNYPHVWAAAEGMAVTMDQGRVEVVIRETRTGERSRMYFPATVSGAGEDGRPFEEKSAIRELSLHGACLFLKHLPRLQSEIKIAIDGPREDKYSPGPIILRGFVVRHDPGPEKHLTAVGIVFKRESDSD